jgi:hypothetical protein
VRSADSNAFTGFITRNNTTAATMRNVSRALMKSPWWNSLAFTVKLSAEKSGSPPIAAISSVIRSSTIDVTTAVNAVPITTEGQVDQVAAKDELAELREHGVDHRVVERWTGTWSSSGPASWARRSPAS